MVKRIIIISVAALVSVSLSLGAVFLLPKFLGSVSEIGVKKNDTVSGGRVSRADSTDAEGAAEESADVPSVSQAQQSRVTKNEEPSISSKAPQQSSSASKSVRKENVTKLFKPAKETVCSSADLTEKQFYDSKSGKTLPYRIYIPKNLQKDKKTPILLLLHGAGERGEDNLTQIRNFKGMFNAAGDIISGSIILAPQCPSGGWWNLDEDGYGDEKGWLGAAWRLLESVKSEYGGDPDRIYITGLSMGGIATWALIDRYPEKFAAAVPVCGIGNSYSAYNLTGIPIKIYHGTADTTIGCGASDEMYNAILSAGGKMVDYKRLYGVGHNAWDTAYSDRDMFCWMFSQTRPKARTGDDSYTYKEKIKLVSPRNTEIFSEKDIDFYFLESSEDGGYSIAASLNSGVYDTLREAYEKNDGKEFTVYYYGKKLYTFIPGSEPSCEEFVFASSVTDYLEDLTDY